MESKLFRLNSRDFVKGLVVAIITAVLVAIQNAISTHGLDFAEFNWAVIINVAITAGIAYLGKNLVSDENDKVLGRF